MNKDRLIKILSIMLIIAGIISLEIPIILKLYGEYKREVAMQVIKSEMSDISLEINVTDTTEANNKEKKTHKNKKNNKESKYVGIINIPSLKIEYPISEGTDNDNIRYTVGHYTGTSNIGNEGNCVIAGHRGGRFGEFFKHLDKLKVNDKVVVTDIKGNEYSYIVEYSEIVEPYDTSVLESKEDETSELTLITCCYTSSGKKRLVYHCIMSS